MRRNVTTVSLNCNIIVCLSSVCVFLRDICSREDNASGTRKFKQLHLTPSSPSSYSVAQCPQVRANRARLNHSVGCVWHLGFEGIIYASRRIPPRDNGLVDCHVNRHFDRLNARFFHRIGLLFQVRQANWTWHLHLTTCLLIAIPKLGKK